MDRHNPLQWVNFRSASTPGPAGPTAPNCLGAATQARVRHRHAALPQLRRRGAQDHRGHPGATGDREDPDPPGTGSAAAAQRPSARGAARLKPPEPRRPSRTPYTSQRAAQPGASGRWRCARVRTGWRKTQGQPRDQGPTSARRAVRAGRIQTRQRPRRQFQAIQAGIGCPPRAESGFPGFSQTRPFEIPMRCRRRISSCRGN